MRCPAKPRPRRFLVDGVMYTENFDTPGQPYEGGQYIAVWVTRPERQHPFWSYFLPEEEIT